MALFEYFDVAFINMVNNLISRSKVTLYNMTSLYHAITTIALFARADVYTYMHKMFLFVTSKTD